MDIGDHTQFSKNKFYFKRLSNFFNKNTWYGPKIVPFQKVSVISYPESSP